MQRWLKIPGWIKSLLLVSYEIFIPLMAAVFIFVCLYLSVLYGGWSALRLSLPRLPGVCTAACLVRERGLVSRMRSPGHGGARACARAPLGDVGYAVRTPGGRSDVISGAKL